MTVQRCHLCEENPLEARRYGAEALEEGAIDIPGRFLLCTASITIRFKSEAFFQTSAKPDH